MSSAKTTFVNRTGSVATLLCVLLLPLLGLLALFVDYAFLLYVRTDLQRSADHAVIAAVRELVPDHDGSQDLEKVADTLRQYIELNMGDHFDVRDSDIEIGRYNPATVYNSVDLLDNGIFDTVRVTIRRDDLANSSVTLYFARIFDRDEAAVNVVSTAILQRGRYLEPGSDVFPVTVNRNLWNQLEQGEVASIYGDGRIEDANGDDIPGNWGTVDIGSNSNSSAALREQIIDGLSQKDLDAMHQQGSIPEATKIDSQMNPLVLNGDTGFSSGLKHAVYDVAGDFKLIPIYKKTSSHGGGLKFDIVGWGAVEIVGSEWHGSKNSQITIRKSYMYDGDLRPHHDLSDTSNSIDSVFTTPVLVQ